MAKAMIVGGGIGGLTAAVVRRSRLVGQVTQLENPLLCRLRDAVTKRTSARAQLRQYEKIARYQA